MGGNVSVDSEAIVLTSSIKTHRLSLSEVMIGVECACVRSQDDCMCMYLSIYVNIVFLKIKDL